MNKCKFIISFLILLLRADIIFANKVISNLVEPVKYFSGREQELKVLEDKLNLSGTVSVTGIRGIGKTQLLRMFASRKSYNLIWFFDCSKNLNEQFAELAENIENFTNRAYKPSKYFKNTRHDIINHLEAKKDWLLVFDNLKINQNDLIKDIVKWQHNGSVIIASQDIENLPSIIQLGVLNENDSKKLLVSLDVKDKSSGISSGYPPLIIQNSTFLDKNISATIHQVNLDKFNDKLMIYIQSVLNALSSNSRELLFRAAIFNNKEFSEDFLRKISKNKKSFEEDFYSLLRFNLIINNCNSELFNVNGILKNNILKAVSDSTTKYLITDIIDKINDDLFSNTTLNKYLLFKNEALLINIENLVAKAESIYINLNKILEIKKNLLNFYLFQRNFIKSEKLIDWLLASNIIVESKLWLMNERDKISYSEYLCGAGIFFDWVKNDYRTSLNLMNKAKNIINSIKGFYQYKFDIYAQLAQRYVELSDIDQAMIHIELAKQLESNLHFNKLDLSLLKYIEAKILLAEGNLDDALSSIKVSTLLDKQVIEEDNLNILSQLLQAKIYNYRQEAEVSYDIAKQLYHYYEINLSHDNNNDLLARILVELSRANLKLGHKKTALEQAQNAKDIIFYNKDRSKKEEISLSHDVYLAAVYVAEADSLSAMKRYDEAIKSYETAEKIFFNRYRDNMNNNFEVSYLYFNAAISCYLANDKVKFNRFKNRHIDKFGIKHPKTIELLKMNK